MKAATYIYIDYTDVEIHDFSRKNLNLDPIELFDDTRK